MTPTQFNATYENRLMLLEQRGDYHLVHPGALRQYSCDAMGVSDPSDPDQCVAAALRYAETHNIKPTHTVTPCPR